MISSKYSEKMISNKSKRLEKSKENHHYTTMHEYCLSELSTFLVFASTWTNETSKQVLASNGFWREK